VDSNFCLPIGVWLLAMAVSCVVIIAGVWGGFTLLRLGPRLATVPGGCVVVTLMIFASAGVIDPLKHTSPPSLWLAALEAGAGLAAFAVVAGGRRVWLAGVLALAVAAAAAITVPPLVRQHQLADARLHQFMALGFPLEAPSVPGYYLSAATTSDGVLVDVIDQAAAPQGPSEILVVIGPVASAWAAHQRALCTGGNAVSSGPLFDCSAIRPSAWLWANSTIGNEIMSEHSGLMAIASASSQPSTVSEATLIAAATSLRMTTAATLAGLPA
jgi:hypothetical protein